MEGPEPLRNKYNGSWKSVSIQSLILAKSFIGKVKDLRPGNDQSDDATQPTEKEY